MDAELLPPDGRALCADLERADWKLGVVDGRWSVRTIIWPHVQVMVKAADDEKFCLRFDCSGYRQVAPTACLWDPEKEDWLASDRFPRGNGGRVTQVFRTDWNQGRALYLPCDRAALPNHEGWLTTHPELLWVPERGITMYMEIVHEILNSPDYQKRPSP